MGGERSEGEEVGEERNTQVDSYDKRLTCAAHPRRRWESFQQEQKHANQHFGGRERWNTHTATHPNPRMKLGYDTGIRWVGGRGGECDLILFEVSGII